MTLSVKISLFPTFGLGRTPLVGTAALFVVLFQAETGLLQYPDGVSHLIVDVGVGVGVGGSFAGSGGRRSGRASPSQVQVPGSKNL